MRSRKKAAKVTNRPGRITVCLRPEIREEVERRAKAEKDPPSTWIKKLVERAVEAA